MMWLASFSRAAHQSPWPHQHNLQIRMYTFLFSFLRQRKCRRSSPSCNAEYPTHLPVRSIDTVAGCATSSQRLHEWLSVHLEPTQPPVLLSYSAEIKFADFCMCACPVLDGIAFGRFITPLRHPNTILGHLELVGCGDMLLELFE